MVLEARKRRERSSPEIKGDEQKRERDQRRGKLVCVEEGQGRREEF